MTYRPALVTVNDDRGKVRGAVVAVSGVTGTVIPPEGNSIYCWSELTTEPAGVEWEDFVAALREAAFAGAGGESGVITLPV